MMPGDTTSTWTTDEAVTLAKRRIIDITEECADVLDNV
jgi:hypothetical protein